MKSTATILATAMFVLDHTTASPSLAGMAAVAVAVVLFYLASYCCAVVYSYGLD